MCVGRDRGASLSRDPRNFLPEGGYHVPVAASMTKWQRDKMADTDKVTL